MIFFSIFETLCPCRYVLLYSNSPSCTSVRSPTVKPTFKQPTLTRTGGFIISTYHPQFTGSASSPECAHNFGIACRAKGGEYRLTQVYSGAHSEHTLHSVNLEHTHDTPLLSGTRSLLHLTHHSVFHTTAHPDTVSRRAEVSDIPGPVLRTRHSATIPGPKPSNPRKHSLPRL